jgi:hypothetical protein
MIVGGDFWPVPPGFIANRPAWWVTSVLNVCGRDLTDWLNGYLNTWRRVALKKLIFPLLVRKISRILCKPNVYFLFSQQPDTVQILSQINLVHSYPTVLRSILVLFLVSLCAPPPIRTTCLPIPFLIISAWLFGGEYKLWGSPLSSGVNVLLSFINPVVLILVRPTSQTSLHFDS